MASLLVDIGNSRIKWALNETAAWRAGAVLHRHADVGRRLKDIGLVRLDPKDANAHNALGQILLELGKRDQAAEQFRRALSGELPDGGH